MSAIYILDRVKLRPGQLQAYQQALRERYLPGARERGMELIGSWTTPPLEVEEGNELVTLWSLPSIEAFWAMRSGSVSPGVVVATPGLSIGSSQAISRMLSTTTACWIPGVQSSRIVDHAGSTAMT